MLPPTLVASLKHIGTPIRTPTGAMSPVEGYKQFLPPVANVPVQQVVAPVPMMAPLPQYQPQPLMQSEPMMMHPQVMMSQQVPQPQIPMMIQQQQMPPEMMMMPQPQMIVQPQPILPPPQMVPMQSAIPIGAVIPTTQPAMMQSAQVVAQPPRPPMPDHPSSGSLLDSLGQAQPSVIASGPLPAAPTPTPPQSGHASRSMSFSEKAPSIPESP